MLRKHFLSKILFFCSPRGLHMTKSVLPLESMGFCLIRGEQKAPENATHLKTQVIDRFQNLLFRVCCIFGCFIVFPLYEGAKAHPKTQHTRKRRFWERSVPCVFGCVPFSGAFWRLPISESEPVCVDWGRTTVRQLGNVL